MGLFTLLRRYRLLIFLLSLPLLPSAINGIIEGYFANIDEDENFQTAIRHYRQNIVRHDIVGWISFPSPPYIHRRNKWYSVYELSNPRYWQSKIELRLYDADDPYLYGPPADLADLTSLSYSTHHCRMSKWKEDPCPPWYRWIYLSNSTSHMEGELDDEWDQAFDELLRYHYPHSGPVGAYQFLSTFSFILCPGSFLCDQWRTRGPALVHLTIASPDDDEESRDFKNIPDELSVTARIIEFPITDPKDLLLPRGTFPSRFEQLRSVTGNPDAWKHYKPHSGLAQWTLRLQDMSANLQRRYAKMYGRLVEVEDWLVNLFGEESWVGLVLMATRLNVLGMAYIARSSVVALYMVGTELYPLITDKGAKRCN